MLILLIIKLFKNKKNKLQEDYWKELIKSEM